MANATTPVIQINEGKVGIGTSTPLAKLDVQGTQGQLFSVTDNLSGSIFAVADISGVPIFDVNSSGVSYFDGEVNISRGTNFYTLNVGATSSGSIYTDGKIFCGGDSFTFGEAVFTDKVGIGITNLSADVGLYVKKAAGTVIKSETTTTNGNPDVHIVDADNANDRASLQVQGNNGAIESLFVASNGSVGIGTTTPGSKLTVVAPFGGIGTDFQISGGSGFGTKNVKIEIPGYGDGLQITSVASSTLDDNAITFYQDANKRGSIVVNATSTSYNTTSDYRLKENKEDISDAIERVKSLKPVKFNWISEPNQPKVDGFYAHELAEIVPQAVTGKKDALDYENKPDHQSIDQSKIVPLLTAALQQAIDKIEALEQRIQLIENK